MHGEYKVPGGKLVVMDLDVVDGRLQNVQLSGDFFLEPDSAQAQINAALDGMPANSTHDELSAAIHASLPADVLMFGISAEAIAQAVSRALDDGAPA